MVTIKTYDEYLNEGFHDWVNKDHENHEIWSSKWAITASLFGVFASIIPFLVNEIFGLCMFMVFNVPLMNFMLKKVLRKPYTYLKYKLLLKKAITKGLKIRRYAIVYPEIRESIYKIEKKLNKHIRDKNKKGISNCVHEIFLLSKDIKRKGLNIEGMGLDNIIEIDPYGEENWEIK